MSLGWRWAFKKPRRLLQRKRRSPQNRTLQQLIHETILLLFQLLSPAHSWLVHNFVHLPSMKNRTFDDSWRVGSALIASQLPSPYSKIPTSNMESSGTSHCTPQWTFLTGVMRRNLNRKKKMIISFSGKTFDEVRVFNYSLPPGIVIFRHDGNNTFKIFLMFQNWWRIYCHIAESYSGPTLFTYIREKIL